MGEHESLTCFERRPRASWFWYSARLQPDRTYWGSTGEVHPSKLPLSKQTSSQSCSTRHRNANQMLRSALMATSGCLATLQAIAEGANRAVFSSSSIIYSGTVTRPPLFNTFAITKLTLPHSVSLRCLQVSAKQ